MVLDLGSSLNTACKIHCVSHNTFVILKAGGMSLVKWMQRVFQVKRRIW